MVKRVWSALIAHPAWVSVGALAAVAAIIVPFLASPSSPSNESTTCSAEGANINVDCSHSEMIAPTPASLVVAALEVGEPKDIDATLEDSGGGTQPLQQIKFPTTPADISLKNNGTMPSLITRAETEVLFSSELKDCATAGGGPAVVSAYYSIKLPTVRNQDGELSVSSGVHSADMRFEVKPGSADRMAISIGPETQSYSSVRPIVIVARLALIHDGDERLDVGTIAVVTSDDAEFQINNAHDEDCAASNLEVLDEVYATQAERSAELDRLRTTYEDLVYN